MALVSPEALKRLKTSEFTCKLLPSLQMISTRSTMKHFGITEMCTPFDLSSLYGDTQRSQCWEPLFCPRHHNYASTTIYNYTEKFPL